MLRTRSTNSRADSPSQPARVLPESEVAALAASSGLQPPVKDLVFADEDEPRPEAGGQVQSAASPPILSAEDFDLGSPVRPKPSPSMPYLEPYWKDDFVFQDPSSLMTDPFRASQLGTGTELGKSKSPTRVCRNLAPVAESESSDVVAIGLDRPCSDNVQVNISSSSFRDEGHQDVFVAMSEVGPRSSEVKVPQVEQEVVRGVGDPSLPHLWILKM